MISLSDRAKEIFAVAIDFKDMKKLLYDGAVTNSVSRAGREAFAFLRDLEADHLTSFLGACDEAEQGPDTNPFPPLKAWNRGKARDVRRIIFEQNDFSMPGPQELITLESALNIEQACIRFLELTLENASENLEKKFLTGMISDEKQHMALLSDLGLHFSILHEHPPALHSDPGNSAA